MNFDKDTRRETSPEKVNEYTAEKERRYYSAVWMEAISRRIVNKFWIRGCRDRPDALSIFHRPFLRYHT